MEPFVPLHSQAYLTDQRDAWWNRDWLDLMARRVGLGEVRRALDVGCGQGHWSRLVLPLLHPEAELVGVEREPEWVRRAQAVGTPRLRVVEGTAESIPFPDGHFDLVTCQTLLIHVADPARVIAEMRRVLRPGGVLLVAEPNNIASVLIAYAAMPELAVDDLLEAVRFQVLVERGKQATGEGYNSAGEGLAGLLTTGWRDVRVWNNDRARDVRPPYDAGMIAEERAFFERGEVGWTRAEAHRWFLAAGGTEAQFTRSWDTTLRLNGLRLAAIDAGTYAAAEGGAFYLVHARRDG